MSEDVHRTYTYDVIVREVARICPNCNEGELEYTGQYDAIRKEYIHECSRNCADLGKTDAVGYYALSKKYPYQAYIRKPKPRDEVEIKMRRNFRFPSFLKRK